MCKSCGLKLQLELPNISEPQDLELRSIFAKLGKPEPTYDLIESENARRQAALEVAKSLVHGRAGDGPAKAMAQDVVETSLEIVDLISAAKPKGEGA